MTSSFPLEYRRTMVHVPIVDKDNTACIHLSTAHHDMIKEIKALAQHFSAASHVADVNNNNAAKCMSFGSRAVGEPMSTTGNLTTALRQESLLGKHGLFCSPMEDYSDPQSLGGLDMYNNQ